MPGILYHLSFAELVWRALERQGLLSRDDKINFLSGNLIPDLAESKKSTHFEHTTMVSGIYAPSLADARRVIFCTQTAPKAATEQAVKLGIYCHLYFDSNFIQDFLIPEFVWDTMKRQITNPRTGKVWTAEVFFSEDGLYGAYTNINQRLLADRRVSGKLLKALPEQLPNSGLEAFDRRREQTWREELDNYRVNQSIGENEVLDYARLWRYIVQLVPHSVQHITPYALSF